MNYIVNHSSLKTNLVSWWEMTDPSGTRYDAHGSNHLTSNGTGGVARLDSSGWSADFESGDSDYLSITDASQSGLDISTAGSWSYWINFESDTDAVVIGKFASGQQSYWIQHMIGSANKFQDSSESDSCLINYTFSTGTWYHVVWTYDAGTVEMFVNGVSQGTDTCSGTSLTNSTAPFEIGRINKYASNYLDGQMRRVGVWSKVLSSSEITDLYNSGSGMSYGIAYDNAGYQNSGAADSSSVSLAALGDDRIAIIYVWTSAAGTPTVTVNGSSTGVTQIGSAINITGTQYIRAYYYLAPPTSSVSYAVSLTSSYPEIHVVTYTGASQTGVPDSYASSTGQSSPYNISTTVVASYSWLISTARDYSDGDITASNVVRNVGAGIKTQDKGYAVSSGSQSLQYTTGSGTMGGFIVSFAPVAAAPSTAIKTVDGLAYASVKTVNGLAVASVKNIMGLA